MLNFDGDVDANANADVKCRPLSIVLMKNGQKNGQNDVTTHSVRFSVRHHWHDAKQKRPVLIKDVKCEQTFTSE